MSILAWHFVGEKLRDGRDVPADGVKLYHAGDLALCRRGLHASVKILDALNYAQASTTCRVECGGVIVSDSDKLVCSERTILWRVNGELLLREFARRQAMSVTHLWPAPDVVKRYLETGDEQLRDAAQDAARAAAQDAAHAAVWGAAETMLLSMVEEAKNEATSD